jgi:hypothetical protein
MQDEDFQDIVTGLFLSPEKEFNETSLQDVRFVTDVLIPQVRVAYSYAPYP